MAFEHRPLACQPIQIRGLGEVMPESGKTIATPLIGGYQQHIHQLELIVVIL